MVFNFLYYDKIGEASIKNIYPLPPKREGI